MSLFSVIPVICMLLLLLGHVVLAFSSILVAAVQCLELHTHGFVSAAAHSYILHVSLYKKIAVSTG